MLDTNRPDWNNYLILLALPRGLGVVSIAPAASDAGQFLDSLDPLDPVTGVPDATVEIAVYDVGQGSANGLISNQEVVCYFDFGGGAAPNTFTFPQKLASFLADWFDNRTGVTKPTPPPHIVRNTEDRTSKGLGHVGFDWTTSASTSALACGADLDIQQK